MSQQRYYKGLYHCKFLEDTNIVFCAKERTDYKIILRKNPSECERYAASELQKYVKKATLATLHIVETDDCVIDDKYISIGHTRLLEKSGISVTEKDLSRDGYKIIRNKNNVYICGGRDSGTAFGVYEFLKHQVGYEAYAADEIHCDYTDIAYLKDFNIVDVPDFKARTMDGIFEHDKETAFKYRILSEHESSAKFDYGASLDWIPEPYHTIKTVMPEAVYNNPDKPETYHPEWYYANEQSPDGLLQYCNCCYSDDSFAKTFAENMIKLIQEKPKGRIVNIAQQDGIIWCHCEKCKAEYEKYRHSGYMIRFANKVVKAVEEWREKNCPERILEYATFSYAATLMPPLDENDNLLDPSCRPHEKLNIRMAFSGGCYYHKLDDPNCSCNSKILNESIKRWTKICSQFYIWAYAAYYRDYMVFFNDFEAVQRNLQIYKENGCDKQIFYQQATWNSWMPFGYLRTYLKAKLMWDVNEDVEILTKQFFVHYYKCAATEMREILELYRELYRNADKESNGELHVCPEINHYNKVKSSEMWTKEIIDKASSLFAVALKNCELIADTTEREKLLKRIRNERICIWYLQLINYDDYDYDKAKYEEFVNKFSEEVRELGICNYKESQSMEEYLQALKEQALQNKVEVSTKPQVEDILMMIDKQEKED